MSKTFFVEDFQLNFETIFLSSAPKVDPIYELYLCKAWRHKFTVIRQFISKIVHFKHTSILRKKFTDPGENQKKKSYLLLNSFCKTKLYF